MHAGRTVASLKAQTIAVILSRPSAYGSGVTTGSRNGDGRVNFVAMGGGRGLAQQILSASRPRSCHARRGHRPGRLSPRREGVRGSYSLAPADDQG
jgi:hypothetical protein